jgi:coenzyme F420 hydrogenase subunit beta
MEDLLKICSEYCTGCGLCHSVAGVNFTTDEKGFKYPELREINIPLLRKVCPAAGNALNNYSDGSIWGNVSQAYLGYANNDDVRFRASSGGVLTALCLYLIDNKVVDAIIQTRKHHDDPRLTETIVSTNRDDVLTCCGSRYTTSTPLMHIKQQVEAGKKYAFVGKPCDVSALRMYQNEFSEEWVKQIRYMLTFYCAGQPSLLSNNKLLNALGCKDIKDCIDLRYRGCGWPGEGMVKLKDGTENTIDYERLWMKILGRDTRRICRFCTDGTGEYSDISCGDAWYLDSANKPDFTERPGRNIIFARTEDGNSLMRKAIDAGYISVDGFDMIRSDEIKLFQPYHYTRKASLSTLKIAMKLCGRDFPIYNMTKLSKFAKGFPLKSKLYRFFGTLQRIKQGKI